MKMNKQYRNKILYTGTDLSEADAVMILIHGRGADAEDISSLAGELKLDKISFAAPDADNNTWYPYSFLEPVERNEPYLSGSLNRINSLTEDFLKEGFTTDKIYFLGFSQGACLALEYCARNPKKYGGIFALSGALIGKEGGLMEYTGSLEGTKIFLGCSDTDPHIPLNRVDLSEEIMTGINGDVTKRIYPGMGHTINYDELDFIGKIVKNSILL